MDMIIESGNKLRGATSNGEYEDEATYLKCSESQIINRCILYFGACMLRAVVRNCLATLCPGGAGIGKLESRSGLDGDYAG